jgi:hypothetical protein
MADARTEWIEGWRRQSLDELAERFSSAGADEPSSWAGSELREDIAQFARYLFLRALWGRVCGYLDDLTDEVERIRTAGGNRDEMRRMLASNLYTLAFDVVYLLDEPDGTMEEDGTTVDVGPEDPRWVLMEIGPDGALTGRDVGGLHESLMETVPGGEANASDVGWF